MGIAEREGREKRTEEIFKTIMIENFPKSMTDTKPQMQEAERTQSRINAKKQTISKHVTFKLQKIKDIEKTLKESRGEKTPYVHKEEQR